MKCFYCKNIIDITKMYDGSYVIDQNHYCHCACFIQYKTNLKRKPWTEDQAIKYLQPLKNKTEEITNKTYYLGQLAEWYCQFYGQKIMPNKAKQLVNMIADGRYKDITIKIPVEDLYQMFIRNQDKLKKINYQLEAKKIRTGQSLTVESMFAYDIAVIINDYNDYCEWKQAALEESVLKKQSLNARRTRIDYTIFKKYHRSENKGADISDIIDDI